MEKIVGLNAVNNKDSVIIVEVVFVADMVGMICQMDVVAL